MTWAGAAVATRRAAPSYQHWKPLPYMDRAADFLSGQYSAALPLRPGGRKTSITLEAFRRVRETHPDATMLVVAPLRVCRQVWRQEAAKWEQFREFKFSLLHGPKKDDRLNDDADIWLINPEGVDWLCAKYFGRNLPWTVVCIDELTKFKNSAAERSKKLRARITKTPYRWGLTGSLAPNGHMDLFGQQFMLDDGAALGRYITHYRDNYFSLGWDGFTYDLMPGAERRILERLAPYWFEMSEEDYAQLPPLVDVVHDLLFEPADRKLYDKMKRDMIATLPEGIVTAANAAACYSKLSQMANGAVYVGDDKEAVSVIHDLKLDAIEDLLEELNGEPLLVGYEFNHDIERLRERFGVEDPKTKQKIIPYLGKGTTTKQEDAWVQAWNRGELPLLCAHPASAGHGLNMQGASAANVCWFGITWDYELYDQFIRRIWRDGTGAKQVFNHLLVVKNTIDELKFAALCSKEMTQSNLLRALNVEIRRNAEALAARDDAAPRPTQETTVVMKLSRPGAAAPAETGHQQTQATQETTAPVRRGWGSSAGAAAPANDAAAGAVEGQRERIAAQLTGQAGENDNRQDTARSAFSGGVAKLRESIQQEHGGDQVQEHSNGVRMDPEPPAPAPEKATTRRTRNASTPAEPVSVASAPVVNVAGHTTNVPDTTAARLVAARVALLTAVLPLAETPEQAIEVAEQFWTWASDVKPF